MKKYTLKVGPSELVIRSDEPVEHITAVQDLIAGAFADAGGDSGRPQHTALAFAALTLADQLIKERSAHRALKERIRSRSRELLQSLATRSLRPIDGETPAVASPPSVLA